MEMIDDPDYVNNRHIIGIKTIYEDDFDPNRNDDEIIFTGFTTIYTKVIQYEIISKITIYRKDYSRDELPKRVSEKLIDIKNHVESRLQKIIRKEY